MPLTNKLKSLIHIRIDTVYIYVYIVSGYAYHIRHELLRSNEDTYTTLCQGTHEGHTRCGANDQQRTARGSAVGDEIPQAVVGLEIGQHADWKLNVIIS